MGFLDFFGGKSQGGQSAKGSGKSRSNTQQKQSRRADERPFDPEAPPRDDDVPRRKSSEQVAVARDAVKNLDRMDGTVTLREFAELKKTVLTGFTELRVKYAELNTSHQELKQRYIQISTRLDQIQTDQLSLGEQARQGMMAMREMAARSAADLAPVQNSDAARRTSSVSSVPSTKSPIRTPPVMPKPTPFASSQRRV